jgi:hypothetical protein
MLPIWGKMWANLAAASRTDSDGMFGSAVWVEVIWLSSAQLIMIGVVQGCLFETLACMPK